MSLFLKLVVAGLLWGLGLVPAAVTPEEAPAAKAAVDTILVGPFHTR